MITFGVLSPDGSLSNLRVIKQADILRCPQVILLADHYREDGSCRCDEPTCEYDGCALTKADGIYCTAHEEALL